MPAFSKTAFSVFTPRAPYSHAACNFLLPAYNGNSGVGSLFLDKMRHFYGEREMILLETEEPAAARNKAEYELRTRRNGFYERNGASPSAVIAAIKSSVTAATAKYMLLVFFISAPLVMRYRGYAGI